MNSYIKLFTLFLPVPFLFQFLWGGGVEKVLLNSVKISKIQKKTLMTCLPIGLAKIIFCHYVDEDIDGIKSSYETLQIQLAVDQTPSLLNTGFSWEVVVKLFPAFFVAGCGLESCSHQLKSALTQNLEEACVRPADSSSSSISWIQ